MFLSEKQKLFIYPFDDDLEIPFGKLGTALVTQETKGHYLVVPVKEKRIKKGSYFFVEKGVIVKDPSTLEYLDYEAMFENGEEQPMVLLAREVVEEPDFEEMQRTLINDGYMKVDRKHFAKTENRMNYEKRFKKLKRTIQ